MRYSIVREGWPFIIGLPVTIVLMGVIASLWGGPVLFAGFLALGLVAAGFMAYFFRDPAREAPGDASLVLSGADGRVRCIELIDNPKFIGRPAVRVSVYLSPMDVHVNRCPIGGRVERVHYVPGKHLLTRNNHSSEFNEHSSIFIRGDSIECLVHQIVGPIVRRVVYWLDQGQQIVKGDRLGLMKFGSRLDVYLPAEDVDILVQEGDKVQAGLSPIARLRRKAETP